jgi:pimeloyl-ACP methyl ester carboxylesterase
MTSTFQSAPTKSVSVDGVSLVYREFGKQGGIPIVFLHHLTAVLEDWDPRLLDGLAATHHVVIFDNRGVGASTGLTPISVKDMADDAIAFIAALGFRKVNLFGFSLGGFVAQMIVHQRPDLVEKLVLTGTGPAGGEGIENVASVLQDAIAKAKSTGKHPKHFLFFAQNGAGQKACDDFLSRLNERSQDRDTAISDITLVAQLAAIHSWGNGPETSLETVRHPVLVANGDDDVMVPTVNSLELARRLPNARLSIFPSAGHGGVFEHHAFVGQVLAFLEE